MRVGLAEKIRHVRIAGPSVAVVLARELANRRDTSLAVSALSVNVARYGEVPFLFLNQFLD